MNTELQSFKSEAQKVVKSLRERLPELEAELDSDRGCHEHVQADALALQAELDGLCLQKAELAQQGLTEAEMVGRCGPPYLGARTVLMVTVWLVLVSFGIVVA